MRSVVVLLSLFLAAQTNSVTSRTWVHHAASVLIVPSGHQLDVSDTLRFMAPPGNSMTFILNKTLVLQPPAGLVTIDPDTTHSVLTDSVPNHARVVTVRAPDGRLPDEILLVYSGPVHHEFTQQEEYARGFSETAGLIDTTGVFLTGQTCWLPTFPDSFIAFTLSVSLPPGWDAVSQGSLIAESQRNRTESLPATGSPAQRWRHLHPIDRDHTVVWQCTMPMEEAYLVAGRYHRFQQPCGRTNAQAYLFDPDTSLAVQYLDATCRYLSMYSEMIGPYPYGKFALVENFWQTGYGMPSFTLLGNRVIRLPFIVHTSYGHEILHNWWGNGVYVDYETGNWCEGLTSYLADHYYKERDGKADQHRRKLLDQYAWYAAGEADFPLTEFTERFSSATAAVGYGKAAMIFHMLRKKLGDEAFYRGVQQLWRERMFRRTSWNDIAHVFTESSGIDLHEFFAQWVEQPGAPDLHIESVESAGTTVHLNLAQSTPQYQLQVPVKVLYEYQDSLKEMHVSLPMVTDRLETTLSVPGPLVRVEVDQEFDLFRLLNGDESPPAFGMIFGADTTAFIATVPESLIVASWPGETKLVPIQPERIVEKDMLIVGGPSGLRALLSSSFSGKIQWHDTVLVVQNEPIDATMTVVAAGLGPGARAVCWIRPAAQLPDNDLASVIKKLTHYDSYSYLVFDGTRCIKKGTWSTECRSMVARLGTGGTSR